MLEYSGKGLGSSNMSQQAFNQSRSFAQQSLIECGGQFLNRTCLDSLLHTHASSK